MLKTPAFQDNLQLLSETVCPFSRATLGESTKHFKELVQRDQTRIAKDPNHLFALMADTRRTAVGAESRILASTPDSRLISILSKAALYARAKPFINKNNYALTDMRSKSPETAGLFMPVKPVTADAPITFEPISATFSVPLIAASFDDIHGAILKIYNLAALHAMVLANQNTAKIRQEDPVEYAVQSALMKHLEDRTYNTLEEFYSGGYELAHALPLELFRVSLYCCSIQSGKDGNLGKYGKDYNEKLLLDVLGEALYKVAHFASLSFTAIQMLRTGPISSEFANGIPEGSMAKFQRVPLHLNHTRFHIVKDEATPRLDLKYIPYQAMFFSESEFHHGCVGMLHTVSFAQDMLRAFKKFIIPNIPAYEQAMLTDIQRTPDDTREVLSQFLTKNRLPAPDHVKMREMLARMQADPVKLAEFANASFGAKR